MEVRPMSASHSITPKGEKLADAQLEDQWNNIDWKKVEKHVNRLQTRIAKAVKEGKWHLVKRLQYLLAHSYYAKLLGDCRKSLQHDIFFRNVSVYII